MSQSETKITKALTINEEGVLNPKTITITPGGTAGTKTTITSTQTGNITVDLKHLSGLTEPITTTYVRVDSKAQPSGVATLDVTGKIPNSQLPTTAMEWLGNWDASTNTPTLADGVGSPGDTYRASVAGTVDFGSGPIVFNISDWVTYSGTVWQQSPSPGAVSSVFARTGAITAQSGDYTKAQVGLGNVDNTSDVNKPVSTAQGIAINAVSTPPGVIQAYGGSTAPTGYLLCDGTSYLRADYPALFAVTGPNFGEADGTHFNVPDLRGMFLRGKDGTRGLDPDKASRYTTTTGAIGNNVGSIQDDATALNGLSATQASHTHDVNVYQNVAGTSWGYNQTINAIMNFVGTVANTLSTVTPSITVASTDNETRPPNVYVNYIIKT